MWGDLGFMFGGCVCESLRRQVLLCESGCDGEGAGIHVCYAHPHHMSKCTIYNACFLYNPFFCGYFINSFK